MLLNSYETINTTLNGFPIILVPIKHMPPERIYIVTIDIENIGRIIIKSNLNFIAIMHIKYILETIIEENHSYTDSAQAIIEDWIHSQYNFDNRLYDFLFHDKICPFSGLEDLKIQHKYCQKYSNMKHIKDCVSGDIVYEDKYIGIIDQILNQYSNNLDDIYLLDLLARLKNKMESNKKDRIQKIDINNIVKYKTKVGPGSPWSFINSETEGKILKDAKNILSTETMVFLACTGLEI